MKKALFPPVKMKEKLFTVLMVCLICSSPFAKAQIVSTIAGNGSWAFTGDGGPATSAAIKFPMQAAFDASGNMYVVDVYNNRIRKITPSGVISTFAGNGAATFAGDGGQATAASLNSAQGVAVDASGNVYIADTYNGRIRKVNTSGIIITIAGNGSSSYTGDGGPGTAAGLYGPYSVITDASGNVFVADQAHNSVRKINSSGTITTVAGTGTRGFSGDGGAATAALFNTTMYMVLDNAGNLYISDFNNNRIRKVSTSGTVTTFAGNGSTTYAGDGTAATATGIAGPAGLAFDAAGNLYYSDYGAHVIRKISTTGIVTTVAGDGTRAYSGDGGWPLSAEFSDAYGLLFNPSGELIICDAGNGRIRKIGANHAPRFTGGTINTINVCSNVPTFPVNAALTFYDADPGQRLRISLLSGPANGTASISYSTTSTGGSLMPSGLYYYPSLTYIGMDSMKVVVSDSIASDTTTVRFNLVAVPATPTISGGTSPICAGSTTTLIGTPSGGFFGSMDANTTTNPTTGVVTAVSGSSSVIYYNGPYNISGCRSQARITLSLLGHPTPATLSGASTVCPGSSIALSASVPGGSWWSANMALATVSSGGSVTGVSSGNTQISYTYSNGCFPATSTVPVTILGITALGPIGGAPNFCEGGTATASNAISGGTWSSLNTSVATINSAGIIYGVAQGVDTIVYNYTNGCGIANSVMKIYNVTGLPRAGAITGPSTMIVGTTANFTASFTGNMASATWMTSSASIANINSAAGVARANSVGIDTIIYKVASWCGVDYARQVVAVTSSRGENNGSQDIGGTAIKLNIFPNPTSGMLSLELEGIASSTGVIISDMSGRVVATTMSDNNKMQVDLSKQPAGTYLVKVISNGETFTQKVVLE